MLLVESVTEGALETCRCLEGEGNSRGPEGTRTFSRRVLRRRWLRLGRRSGPVALVAEAGSEGLRKVVSPALSLGSVVVRWNLRRTTFDSAGTENTIRSTCQRGRSVEETYTPHSSRPARQTCPWMVGMVAPCCGRNNAVRRPWLFGIGRPPETDLPNTTLSTTIHFTCTLPRSSVPCFDVPPPDSLYLPSLFQRSGRPPSQSLRHCCAASTHPIAESPE